MSGASDDGQAGVVSEEERLIRIEEQAHFGFVCRRLSGCNPDEPVRIRRANEAAR